MGGGAQLVRRSYSKSFKEKIKERLLEPGIVKSLLSEETGVPASTLCRWQAQALSLGSMGGKKKAKKRKTQRNWTALQKAQILARASELEGDERHSAAAGSAEHDGALPLRQGRSRWIDPSKQEAALVGFVPVRDQAGASVQEPAPPSFGVLRHGHRDQTSSPWSGLLRFGCDGPRPKECS